MNKSSTKINIVFLLYLILCSHISSISIKNRQDTAGTAVDSGKMAGTCLKALMDNVPPEFCWKKGADVGVIPTGCPDGYFRSLALCYQHCSSGYRHVLGICWADCGGGYADHGLTCYKGFFNWYFKHSYIPKSLTNFSDKVPCPKGMYRQGALCYRNCNNIGLVNCGIGACSSSSESCGSAIAKMVVDTLSGIADGIMTIVSAGGAKGIKSAIKGAASKLGKAGLKAAVNSIKKIFTSSFRDIILEKAKRAVINTSKDLIKGKLTEFAVTEICKAVWNTAITKTISAPEVDENKIADALDVFNVKGITTSCKDTSTEKGALDCSKNVLSGLSAFDPTGLLTIASAFMHPTCEVTTEVITPTEDYSKIAEAIKQLENSKEHCITLYEKCNYQGKSVEICTSGNVPTEFNDKANSMKVGTTAKGLLFQHLAYNGKAFPFGPGMLIPCFNDVKMEGIKLNDVVSSVLFNGDDCFIMRYLNKEEVQKGYRYERNHIFCPPNKNNINVTCTPRG